MTTNAWLVDVDVVDVTPIVGYRKFITDFSDGMLLAGFAREESVGDIDIPALTTVPAGYQYFPGHQIYYMDDSFHATAPIYIKIEYGRGGGVSAPTIGMSAGTGHDGNGNLSGIFMPRMYSYLGAGAKSLVNLKCYSCAIDGASWLMFAEGYQQGSNPASSTTQGHFIGVFRTTDSSGQPTGDGCAVYMIKQNQNAFGATTRSLKGSWVSTNSMPNTAGVGNSGAYACNAIGQSESVTADLQKQVMPHILPFPDFQVMAQIGSLLPGDNIASGTQFQAALKGADLRNYIAVHGCRDRTHEVIGLIWE